MTGQTYNPTGDYQPKSTVEPPVLYSWPPRPLAILKYLLIDLLFPRNHLDIGFALICRAWHNGSKESLMAQKVRSGQRRETRAGATS